LAVKKINALLLATSLLIGTLPDPAAAGGNSDALAAAIASRGPAQKARDAGRHPAETLEFFRVEPGMTVAEVLPGKGWYSRILALYLGPHAALYGVNYSDNTWYLFDRDEKWIEQRIASTDKYIERVHGYVDNAVAVSDVELGNMSKETATAVDRTRAAAPGLLDDLDTDIEVRSFNFNTVPVDVAGTVDRVLFIRALHHLYRLEARSGALSQALVAVRGMLKEDGLVGVVQHRLDESAPEEGADGSRGYLKQSAVIRAFEQVGFELVAESEINANPKDKPGPFDTVWRLPPTLMTSQDDPELRAEMEAVGESNRMTLLFRTRP
jgi:predicted methyltransferase